MIQVHSSHDPSALLSHPHRSHARKGKVELLFLLWILNRILNSSYALVGSQNHPAKFNPIYRSVWKVSTKKGLTCSTWVKPIINSLVQVCTSTVRSLVPRLHLSWGNGLVKHSFRPHLSISVWSGHKTKQCGPKFLLDPPYHGNQFQIVDENRLTIFIVLRVKIVSFFSSI